MERLAESFWSRVDKNGPEVAHVPGIGNCWLWTRGVTGEGYGSLSINGKHHKAHRVAYELAGGKIPRGLLLLHRCDVRKCVRPDHLFVGTQKDNMADCLQKRRFASGSRNGKAKFSAKQVEEIRRLKANGIRSKEIAQRFMVDEATVQRVVKGKCYRMVG